MTDPEDAIRGDAPEFDSDERWWMEFERDTRREALTAALNTPRYGGGDLDVLKTAAAYLAFLQGAYDPESIQ